VANGPTVRNSAPAGLAPCQPHLLRRDIMETRMEEIIRQIYSMENAYDDCMTNYLEEWEALHRELKELENNA